MEASQSPGSRLPISIGLEAPPHLEIGNPLGTIPLELLVEAGRQLVYKCPGVSFVHGPTFFQSLREGRGDQLKFCALLAVFANSIPELVALHGSKTRAGQLYADFTRGQLLVKIGQGPNIETVHCLLLMGMYEWGQCSGFNAWIYVGMSPWLVVLEITKSMAYPEPSPSGMAIRMCQVLRPISNSNSQTGETSCTMAMIREETRIRTIWSCYAMDRILSCGKDRPTAFDSTDMQIPLPLSESDYAFGYSNEERRTIKAITSGTDDLKGIWTMDHHFTIVLRGSDIFATMFRWAAGGGRKKYHILDECPWKSTSTWHKMNQDLETWRFQQDERVKYAPGRLAIQIHRGYPEAYAYINLLYCLWYAISPS